MSTRPSLPYINFSKFRGPFGENLAIRSPLTEMLTDVLSREHTGYHYLCYLPFYSLAKNNARLCLR